MAWWYILWSSGYLAAFGPSGCSLPKKRFTSRLAVSTSSLPTHIDQKSCQKVEWMMW